MKKVYLIAVVFALLAAFATYMFATQLDKKTTIRDAETVPVVFALKEVEENTIITAEMLTEESGFFSVKQVPTEFAEPDHVEKLEDLTDKVTSEKFRANEQVDSTMFVDENSDEIGLSFKIQDGHQAYALPASGESGVDGYITPGDTVDILTYETGKDGKGTSKYAYKNLRVIRVSNNSDNATATSSDSKITSYNTITVDVTPEQASQINTIVKSMDYKLVLNSRKSDTKTTQPQTTEANA